MNVRWFVSAAALVPVACVVYTPDLVEESSSSGGGATASTTTAAIQSTATTTVATTTTAASMTTTTGDPCPGGGCSCDDAEQGGTETDVDCGGTCPPCRDGGKCLLASDCESGVCDVKCKAPSCGDKVKNGDETDIDCGGSCATKCFDGEGCLADDDCLQGTCEKSVCQEPKCGDGKKDAGETCDDGNTLAFDSCSVTCQPPAPHLLLSEIVVGPTASEFIELYNPTATTVDLSNYYLADHSGYHKVTSTPSTGTTDFVIRFPAGATIAPKTFVTVSLRSAAEFKAAFGAFPTFDLAANDGGAPTMTGSWGASYGLTDTGELVMLFRWDGIASTVVDVDHVVWKTSTDKVDKTAVVGYLPDTPPANQVYALAPASGKSLHRCVISEDGEKKTGGNGSFGHDETSESGATAWKVATKPSPGAAPDASLCP
ncbi:MAG: lamin tail domain-containing protein [Deltaproteobacteria bacterium]|nr:lamin tail domain-containing protein [Deltaproteobacteria bacterium]